MNLRATEMTKLRLWTTSFSCARLSPLRARRVTTSSVSRSNGGCARISLMSGARSSNSLRSRILFLPLPSSIMTTFHGTLRSTDKCFQLALTGHPDVHSVHGVCLDAVRPKLLHLSRRVLLTHDLPASVPQQTQALGACIHASGR